MLPANPLETEIENLFPAKVTHKELKALHDCSLRHCEERSKLVCFLTTKVRV